jgi:hypothetical protein
MTAVIIACAPFIPDKFHPGSMEAAAAIINGFIANLWIIFHSILLYNRKTRTNA